MAEHWNCHTQKRLLIAILFVVSVVGVAFFFAQPSERVTLLSWSETSNLNSIRSSHATASLKQRPVNEWGLQVVTNIVDWPSVKLTPGLKDYWDGRDYQFVTANVTNVGKHPVEVGIRIEGIAPAPSHNLSDRICLVLPGETRKARANLFVTPWCYREVPKVNAMSVFPGQSLLSNFGTFKSADTNGIIRSVKVYLRKPSKIHQILVGDVQLETPMRTHSTCSFFPIVDRFGQLKATNWPGKVGSDNELIANARKELAQLYKSQRPENWSAHGGWLDGLQKNATGAFRTEKVDGRWWLVDPDGYLFWSHGVDGVSTAFSGTGTQHRENYFQWLPPNNGADTPSADRDPLGNFYYRATWAHSGFYRDNAPYWSYNFLLANLYRQFGADWQSAFEDIAHQRLLAWRMNTMAAWSDPKVTSWQKSAYTAFVRISDCPFIEGSQANWQQFVDVYAPDFEDAVTRSLQTRAGAFDDPWCIGFFVDNELSWGDAESLADGVIRSPPTQPAKQEWIKFLKQKYPKIEVLNETWRSKFADWDEMLNSRVVPNKTQGQDFSLEDRTAFSRQIMDCYFSTIAKKLNELAPDRLYLGCRFFWNNDAALTAAAKYCDVVSINRYNFLATDVSLPEDSDKPIVIGEFHFGATDRGMLHPTNVPTDNQADRAAKYEGFVESALRNPAIVGTHWFQYVDNPVTGRGDGNNANVGLISITHAPYPELVEAITQVGERMYQIRSSAKLSGPQ